MTMGVSGALNSTDADYEELGRLVPEKLAAIAESTISLFDRSAQMVQQIARFTMDEMLQGSRTCVTLASCPTPAALLVAHQGLTFAWLTRMMSGVGAIGALAIRSHDDAVTPFHRAATANAVRLNGG